ncbi:MAG: polyprenyl synthetase family protein [Bacteroidota bacterium]
MLAHYKNLIESEISRHSFGSQPKSLYEPIRYLMKLGGKRLRPMLVMLSYSIFKKDAEKIVSYAAAVEAFHNFTLMHDDIMDKAPLRRGKATVHAVHGESTALLGGDVMMVVAYDYLNKIDGLHLKKIIHLFNKTAKEVCEGQQLDMDFEKLNNVQLDEYIHMIQLKTSVLLAASLQLGSIIGGASEHNQGHLYEFGRNLGIAFQIQDDYLDAFGDPEKFGKQVGGDIQSNKKTFLLIHALETAKGTDLSELKQLLESTSTDKVEKVLSIYRKCGIDAWANTLKETYLEKAYHHLNEIAVSAVRKEPLKALAQYLIKRDK